MRALLLISVDLTILKFAFDEHYRKLQSIMGRNCRPKLNKTTDILK